MRKDITITAAPRDSRGKNEARRLRASGMAPAVVYGAGTDPVAVSIDPKAVHTILRSASGHNTIFNIDIQGSTAPVMLVDWQHDPIKGKLLHVDMKRIDLTKRIAVKVPVHTTGEAKGIKQQGGVYEIVTREIEIECLPDDIPESFTVDVTELLLNQSLRAGEVPLPETIKLLSPPETVISHVVGHKEEVVEEAAVAAVAEPEVIKKGKKDEEAVPEPKKK